jgi:hypothetical protein
MVSKDHNLSVRRQCVLLTLARSNLYYEPKGESAENLRFMAIIDKQFLRLSDLLCMSDLSHVSSFKEHDHDDDIERLDLSRFRAAPIARLSHLPFESDRAFPTQC